MVKRLWKNVILVCCILALVVQPVNIYADSVVYTYNDLNDFDNAVWNYNHTTNIIGVTGLGTSFDTIINTTFSTDGWTITANDCLVFQGNEILYGNIHMVYAIPYDYIAFLINGSGTIGNNQYRLDVQGLSNYTGQTFIPCFVYDIGDSGEAWIETSQLSAGQIWSFDTYNYRADITYNGTSGTKFVYKQNGSSTDTITYLYDSSYVPPSPVTPTPSNPTVDPNVDYATNIYYQLGYWLSLNFNSLTPNMNTHFNPTWVGVGQALTYDYLCKTNKNSATVSLTLSDGNSVTLSNYLYGEPNYSADIATISSNLASCKSTLSTISSRVNTTNTRLNTINTTLTNQLTPLNDNIADVTDRLENAFPDDQAAINDSIAETLLDNSSGSGLTAGKVSDAKSSFDDALSVYSVSSDIDALSAITGGDWSFWSQTTVNNLGSGYSFNVNGLLMDDSDIFEDNQRTLLDLLGW